MAVTRIKVAQFANGTDGELITWDASGVPATVAVGTAGHVLTSNGIGAAPTFQAVSGGGSSSGISGAVQFSGGSGAFSSDATNFFFNDSTNQLQLAGGTGTNLLLAGLNGGITVTPSSSITGAYSVLSSSFNATGSINLGLVNTNTADSTSNVRVSLTTSTGGGDPFLLINTAEAGYILGVDNSGGDKFYIGTGTTPSSMTVSNIIIDGTKMGVQQATPTAKLHLAAGSSTSNTAPLKIDTGTALATPEDGAMEYHSSHLYFTIGSTRYQLDQQGASTIPFSGLTAATGSNTLDNTNHIQTWNWSTLSTSVGGLTLTANALTTGNLVSISSSNNSINSTNGILYVGNGGTGTSGSVFKVQSNNNVANAGLVVRANGNTGIGTVTPTAQLHIGGTPNIAYNSANGNLLSVDGGSGITDTTSSGTVSHNAVSSFIQPQLYANSTTTYTNASTLYIGGSPIAITNVTITNPWALYVQDGKNFFGYSISTNNSALDLLTLKSNTSHGSGAAANFGTAILFQSESTTTDNLDQTRISSIWSTATHASRQSAIVFSTVFNAGAITELVRMDGKQMKVAGQYASTRFGLTDGATIALDWNNSNVQSVTLAGNRTFTFANPIEGGRYIICLKQDATGSRTITWPTITWAGGTAPTLTTTANKMDIITLVYANSTYYGEISKNY